MKFNPFCVECQIHKHERKIQHFHDENKKKEYMDVILHRYYEPNETDCIPAISTELKKYYSSFWNTPMEDFSEINREYNQLMMDIEEDLFSSILKAPDPLSAAFLYARTGNYIDFAALPDVNKETALSIIKSGPTDTLDEKEYTQFCFEAAHARTLVYITDNCGEIVLDKLAIKILKKRFPNLRITVLVRGLPAANDATLEDAKMCGLTKIVPVIGNGSDVGGTWLHGISQEAHDLLYAADIILSKGQGNYETLHGCGLNIYYLFLCKCELFIRAFHARPLQGMFVNERRSPENLSFREK